MKTITLKNIPPSVHAALKQRAKQHGRSLNREALACLESSVEPARINADAMLLDIQNHRASLPGELNDHLIITANEEGRP